MLRHWDTRRSFGLRVSRRLNSSDSEAGGLEKSADFGRIVPLEFDLAVSNGSAAAAGLASLSCELFNGLVRDLRLEIINNNHGLPSALSFLATQNHAAVFERRLRLFLNRCNGPLGQAVELEGGKGAPGRTVPIRAEMQGGV